MTAAGLLAVAALSVVGACFSAMAARALRDFSSHELLAICEAHKRSDLFADIIRHREAVAFAAENLRVIFSAIAASMGSLGAWLLWGQPPDSNWPKLAAAWAFVVLLLLTAAIWIPHAIVSLWSELFLFYTWGIWRTLGRLLSPLLMIGRAVNAALHKLAGRRIELPNEESVEDEIRSIVTEGHHEGFLEAEAREMIESVIELGDVQVSEIMTPRTDIVAIGADTAWDEVVRQVIDSGHTRIPVYSKNRDDVIGMLYAKDLLPELAKQPHEPIRPLVEILRKPHFVPETKLVTELLQEFQSSRTHIAVVLNEFGGLSGLVSIEDVLEEIVGEIEDEYDEDLIEGIKAISDNVYEVYARLRIEELNERLGLSLPEDQDFETVGGFVFHELGRIPAVGEELTRPDIRIRVIDATRRRIDRVMIEVVDAEQKSAVGEE